MRGTVHVSVLALTAIAVLNVSGWLALRSRSTQPSAPTLDTPDLLAALRAQRWPEGLDLPAHYRDPELFFLKRHREAQSALMTVWNSYSRDQKLEVLEEARRLHTPFVFPYLAEIAWFTIAQETDHHLAANLFAALGASSHSFIDLAIFVCEFVHQNAADDQVAQHAEACRTSLVDRRQRLGY
jgi:hypothetical protein